MPDWFVTAGIKFLTGYFPMCFKIKKVPNAVLCSERCGDLL